MTTEKKLPGENITRSNKIVEWLKSHDLISRNALSTKVGYNVSSLHKVINGTGSYIAIPPKHLDQLEEILTEYGFDRGEKTNIKQIKEIPVV